MDGARLYAYCCITQCGCVKNFEMFEEARLFQVSSSKAPTKESFDREFD